MSRHESTCIKNPTRSCYMCGEDKPEVSRHVALLKASESSVETLDRLRDLCGNCPLCMFAAISQAGLVSDYGYQSGTGELLFNYKEERDEFQAEMRDLSRREKYEGLEYEGWDGEP